MGRVGVAYVAVVAAGLSVGALGFSVFWAYQEDAAPPVVQAIPPVPAKPVVKTPAASLDFAQRVKLRKSALGVGASTDGGN